MHFCHNTFALNLTKAFKNRFKLLQTIDTHVDKVTNACIKMNTIIIRIATITMIMLVLLALVLQSSRLSNVTQAHSGSFILQQTKSISKTRKLEGCLVYHKTLQCARNVHLRFSSSNARTISRIRASLFSFAGQK